MARIAANCIAIGLLACTCYGQEPSSRQGPLDPPVLPTLASQPPPRWIVFPEPPSLPSPPDAPMPDLGTIPGPPEKSKSKIKRAIDRAKPNCLDTVIHTCWSSPPGDNLSKEDRDFADDMDIGSLACKYKNYRGAELRFRHALEIKPGQPEATFKLAEALEKLGNGQDTTGKMRLEEAKQAYQEYLATQRNGKYAERARQAIERLSSR